MKIRRPRRAHPHHFFSREEKRRIVEAIAAAEGKTSGEIRVHVESSCGGDPLARARQVFTALGMDRTAARNGVLIYLAVRDRCFAVIGDEGIDRVVPAGFWEETKDVMEGYFREGRFVEGILHGIASAGAHLAAYFPRRPDDVNELPDAPSEGE
ncbi:MAG: TPM domain-containing protein [Firmicutes bacterium]|nr:TPM domain-containing protein [Bacillota bacterium]